MQDIREEEVSTFAQKEQEVLEWAKETVKAQGAKFSALTKQAQYNIAQYILHLKKEVDFFKTVVNKDMEQPTEEGANVTTDAEAQGDTSDVSPTQEQDDTFSNSAGLSTADTFKEEDSSDAELKPVQEEKEEQTIPPCKISRGLKFHLEGFDAQKAYDIYLATVGEGRGTVLDFRSGKESREAAFAYWLMGQVPV